MKKDHAGPHVRTVTPREFSDQQQGHTRIAPGIWIDRDGDVHYSIPELLALVQLPDTPANRAQVAEMIARDLRATGATVIVQDLES